MSVAFALGFASLPSAFAVVLAPALIATMLVAAAMGVFVLAIPVAFLAVLTLLAAMGVPLLLAGGWLSVLPVFGQATVTAGIAAILLFRLMVRRERLGIPPYVAISIALYVVGMSFSVVVGAFTPGGLPDGALGHFLRQLSYIAALPVGIVAGGSLAKAGLVRTMGLVLFGGIASTIFAWLVSAQGIRTFDFIDIFVREVTETSEYGVRSTFPFVDDSPNLNAVILVIIAAGLLPIILRRSGGDRFLGAVILLGLVCAVFVTQSRTGIIVLAVSVVPVVLCNFRSRFRAIIPLLGLICAIAYVGYQYLPAERAISLNADTFLARRAIWGQGLDDFADSPIIGHGFQYSSQEIYSQDVPGSYISGEKSIHSDYLGSMIDGGIIGVILFVAPMVSMVRVGLLLLQGSELARSTGIATLSVVAVLAISMSVGSTLESAAGSISMWLLYGIAVGALGVRSPLDATVARPRPLVSRRRMTRAR